LRETHRRRGFTLLELLIVIAIIAVLATLLIGALSAARKRSQIAVARSQINAIKAALSMYESDQGRYPRLAPRASAPGNDDPFQDDAPALYAGLMNRPTLTLGGGQNAPYLVDWKPEFIGKLNTTYLAPSNMGNDWSSTDPWGVTLLEPDEYALVNQPNFQDNLGPQDNPTLVLLDPWGHPYHYREWASLRQSYKDGVSPGGSSPKTRGITAPTGGFAGSQYYQGDPPRNLTNLPDFPHNPQQFDVWSNGPNGVNEFGHPDSDDVTSWN